MTEKSGVRSAMLDIVGYREASVLTEMSFCEAFDHGD